MNFKSVEMIKIESNLALTLNCYNLLQNDSTRLDLVLNHVRRIRYKGLDDTQRKRQSHPSRKMDASQKIVKLHKSVKFGRCVFIGSAARGLQS